MFFKYKHPFFTTPYYHVDRKKNKKQLSLMKSKFN